MDEYNNHLLIIHGLFSYRNTYIIFVLSLKDKLVIKCVSELEKITYFSMFLSWSHICTF